MWVNPHYLGTGSSCLYNKTSCYAQGPFGQHTGFRASQQPMWAIETMYNMFGLGLSPASTLDPMKPVIIQFRCWLLLLPSCCHLNNTEKWCWWRLFHCCSPRIIGLKAHWSSEGTMLPLENAGTRLLWGTSSKFTFLGSFWDGHKRSAILNQAT